MVGEPYNSNVGAQFHWIEIDASNVRVPDSWYDFKTALCLNNMLNSANWYCEPSISLNPEKMQEDIKKELLEKYRKTLKWQKRAIKHSIPTD